MTGDTQAATTTANVEATATDTVQATPAAQTTTPSEGGEGAKPEVQPTDVQQPAAGEEAKPDGEAADADVGAPAEYADFTMPEGLSLDEAGGNAFKSLAKEANLSQVQAQKLVDLASQQVSKVLTGYQEQANARIAQWAEQAKADPEVGGPKYAENVQVALEAVSKFGDPELKQAFEEFGLGNHPAFIRAFHRIGKAMGESGFVHGRGDEQPAKPMNREQALAAKIAAEQARNPVNRGDKPPK